MVDGWLGCSSRKAFSIRKEYTSSEGGGGWGQAGCSLLLPAAVSCRSCCTPGSSQAAAAAAAAAEGEAAYMAWACSTQEEDERHVSLPAVHGATVKARSSDLEMQPAVACKQAG